MSMVTNYIQGNLAIADTSRIMASYIPDLEVYDTSVIPDRSRSYGTFYQNIWISCVSDSKCMDWNVVSNNYIVFDDYFKIDTFSAKGIIDDWEIACTIEKNHYEKLDYNINQLKDFLSYKENWNLYGAKPISRTVIESVKKLIMELDYQPMIQATPSGGIALEYLEDNRDYLLFDFFADGKIEMFFFSGDRKKSMQHPVNKDEINRIVVGLKNGDRFC